MKKLLLISLFFNLSVFAQEVIVEQKNEMKDFELTENISKPLTKKIHYNIEILKANKIVYKSEFQLKNSEIFSLVTISTNKVDESAIENLSLKDNENTGNTEIDSTKSEMISYIKMVVYTDKKDKNLWTTLFIEDGKETKNQLGSIEQSVIDKKKTAELNYNNLPKNNYNKNQIIISHYNGKLVETSFDDYIIKINGKIIK